MSLCNLQSIEASQIKNGTYVLIDQRPCIIQGVLHTKPHKNQFTRANLTGLDLLTKKRLVWSGQIKWKVMTFIPIKQEYQLLHVNERSLVCLDHENQEKSILINNGLPLYRQIKQNHDQNQNQKMIISAVIVPIENTKDNYTSAIYAENFKIGGEPMRKSCERMTFNVSPPP